MRYVLQSCVEVLFGAALAVRVEHASVLSCFAQSIDTKSESGLVRLCGRGETDSDEGLWLYKGSGEQAPRALLERHVG